MGATPAVEPWNGSRSARVLIAAVRVGVACLWIQNSSWKRPPDFGELSRPPDGLYKYTHFAIDNPVLPPYTWLIEHVVLPNFVFFGWLTLLVEAALGAFLLVGLATRLWAVVGIAQTVAITLSVLNAPHEWHWSYFLMLLAHCALLATAAGRAYGLDGVLRPAWRDLPGWRGRLLRAAS